MHIDKKKIIENEFTNIERLVHIFAFQTSL